MAALNLRSGPGQTAPVLGTVAYVLGTAQAAGRAILFDVTVVGNCTVTFADGSTLTLTFPAIGLFEFNWAVQTVSAGTATLTAQNLL